MARGLQVWSKTAATNSSADGGVNWAEGMAPSAVNDSARAEMASMAMWRDDNNGSLAGTLSTATYSVTSNQTAAALTAGYTIAFQLGSDMPATALLNLDGLGAKPLRPNAGVDFLGGEYKANQVIRATYFTSNSGEWLIKGTLGARDFTVSNKLTLSGTGDMVLPTGTTGQQPSAETGGFRYNSTTGAPEFSNGTSWLPLLFTLSGAQSGYGAVVNGTIAESHSANAVTFALKTLAGNDPSAGDPVIIAFRNSTAGTGNYVYKTVTAALSLVISSGSTVGASNNVAFKLWLVLFNDSGTVRLGAINCVSGLTVYPLGQAPLASSTAEGGLGAADSAQVFYTGTAVTSMPYVILGYAAYESGLSSVGAWAASPGVIQLFGPGIPLPGSRLQVQRAETSAVATGTTVIPNDDTIPQSGEGNTYLTAPSLTPGSGANLLKVSAQLFCSNSAASSMVMTFLRDAGANSIAATIQQLNTVNRALIFTLNKAVLAGSTSATVFKANLGGDGAGTTTVNGVSGARLFGGAAASFIEVEEIMT